MSFLGLFLIPIHSVPIHSVFRLVRVLCQSVRRCWRRIYLPLSGRGCVFSSSVFNLPSSICPLHNWDGTIYCSSISRCCLSLPYQAKYAISISSLLLCRYSSVHFCTAAETVVRFCFAFLYFSLLLDINISFHWGDWYISTAQKVTEYKQKQHHT